MSDEKMDPEAYVTTLQHDRGRLMAMLALVADQSDTITRLQAEKPEAPPCPHCHLVHLAGDSYYCKKAPPCPGIVVSPPGDRMVVEHCPGCGSALRLTAKERDDIEAARFEAAHCAGAAEYVMKYLLAILDRLAPPKGAPR